MQRSDGSWPDRAVIAVFSILFLLCLRALIEVYDALKDIRNNYDYLNNRMNQIEIEMNEHHHKIKNIEKAIFNDWEELP